MSESAYVVCAASEAYRFLYIEEVIFLQKWAPVLGKAERVRIEVEVIFPDRPFTLTQQRRRARLLSLLKRGQFKHLVFKGDVPTPYVCALRRAAALHTEVHNSSQEHSQLDFFLEMFEFDRNQNARA